MFGLGVFYSVSHNYGTLKFNITCNRFNNCLLEDQ